MANFTPVRAALVKWRLEGIQYSEMVGLMEQEFGYTYNLNHLSSILANEIPKQIAKVAL
jgi:hypothetical protein